MNLDLLIEALGKISGAVGDANWWVNEAADDITSVTDEIDEQYAIAELLDSIHRAIAEVETAIDTLIEDISEQESVEGLRFPKVAIRL